MEDWRMNKMKTYRVVVTETLQRIVYIDAKSAEEASREVEEQYYNEKIVLDSSDYQDTKIEVVEDDN